MTKQCEEAHASLPPSSGLSKARGRHNGRESNVLTDHRSPLSAAVSSDRGRSLGRVWRRGGGCRSRRVSFSSPSTLEVTHVYEHVSDEPSYGGGVPQGEGVTSADGVGAASSWTPMASSRLRSRNVVLSYGRGALMNQRPLQSGKVSRTFTVLQFIIRSAHLHTYVSLGI